MPCSGGDATLLCTAGCSRACTLVPWNASALTPPSQAPLALRTPLTGWYEGHGRRYEGLMKDGQCHGTGVFQYADGDRFEGEYSEGLMDGLGVYQWANGSVFMGQWKENNMHGCGKKYYPGGAIEEVSAPFKFRDGQGGCRWV
jgi:hypothetical protein